MTIGRILFNAGVGLFLILIVSALQGEARTMYVDMDPGAGAEFTSISDALNASTDWDMIKVNPGVYYENVRINRTVSLVNNGTGEIIITGGGNGDVMQITAERVQLRGLTVTGSGTTANGYGAGVRITADNVTITNIRSYNNFYGMFISEGNLTLIKDCNVSGNSGEGLRVLEAFRSIITGNDFLNNGNGGISLVRSIESVITRNTLGITESPLHPSEGITLEQCERIQISANNLENASIYIDSSSLEHWNTHSIDSLNMINGRPVFYAKNGQAIPVPENVGQVIIANCTDLRVENLTLNYTWAGILVGFSRNITIYKNVCSNAIYGIYLISSSSCIISWNAGYFCEETGLYLSSCTGMGITNNYFTLNGAQINTGAENGHGIELRNSNLNWLMDNIVVENSYSGIHLNGSSSNVIQDNNISRNFGGRDRHQLWIPEQLPPP